MVQDRDIAQRPQNPSGVFGALIDNPHLDKRAQRQRVEDLVARPEQQPPVGTRVLLEYLHNNESAHHGKTGAGMDVPQLREVLNLLPPSFVRPGDRCSLHGRAPVSPSKAAGGF